MKISRPQDLGALIRNFRTENGLNQSELAQQLQTSQRWVSHLENGKPTVQLGLVLRALNELGFTVSITHPGREDRSAQSISPRSIIDDIVDG